MVATAFAFSNAIESLACGNPSPSCIWINSMHPDLPLRLYASGKLGVLQPGWAKSYLLIYYRYLINRPLDEKEKAGILKVWHQRLNGSYSVQDLDDALYTWNKARKAILGKDTKDISPYKENLDYSNSEEI